ncbi:MAG: tetratricopeptide repeat protein [Verrucomicrobia bacterium]|nr:tetratricopeptide repeat protein [Verrucomicrobiota bacterium]
MPEKSISEIPQKDRELFEKGTSALQRKNLDYAIALFYQVLQNEPAFYKCRVSLRATQREKVGSGTSFFKKVLGTASNSPLIAKAQLALRNNPIEAIAVAEQILNTDPNNVSAHKILAEAALELDFPQTAVLSLEIALRQSPKDKDIALKLGNALTRTGQEAKAVSIFIKLQEANPNDMEIAQALKNFSAQRTLSEGGYKKLTEGKGSFRDILKNEDESLLLEQENRQVKTVEVADKLVAEYEAQIQREPDNLKPYRLIAEIYANKKDFDQALEYYGKLEAREGGTDPSLDQRIIEITLKRFELALSELNQSDPDCASKRERIITDRDTYRLTEIKQLAEKYPTDLQIRFDLGKLYFELGKTTEAIQEFQKAQNNPHRRIAAMCHLGQCFSRRGMDDLAARTFQNALKEKPEADDEKMELTYRLGCVLEKLGKAEDAMEQFKQIYEVDIGYRDVAARVDNYYLNPSQT